MVPLTALLVVCADIPARAAQLVWTGNVNNKLSVPGNWQSGVAPHDGDDLLFFENASTVVNDLSGLVVDSITFQDNDCTLNGSTIFIKYQPTNTTLAPYAIRNDGDQHTTTINCDIVLQSDATFLSGDASGGVVVTTAWCDLHLNGNIDLAGHNLTCKASTFVYSYGDGTGDDYGYGDIYYDGTISGTGNVSVHSDIKSYNEFSGASGNLFRGTLTIGADADGGVILEVQSGVATTDALVVEGQGFLRLGRSDQIGDSATVTVQQGATFKLNNFNETIGSLVLNTHAADPAPAGLDTGNGTLVVMSNIFCLNDSGSASLITGKMNLPAGGHEITVEPYSVSSGAGLDIQAQIIGSGGFSKDGPDPLSIDRANTFDGNVFVLGGTLYLKNPNGLGSAAGTTTLNGGALDISSLTVTNEAMVSPNGFLRGSGTCDWTGPISVTGNLYVQNYGELTLGGVISGSGNVSYQGGGPVLVTGSTANTYTGTTLVAGALVEFYKPGSVKAFSGPLVVGTTGLSPGDLPSCEARWINYYQALDAAVTVNGTGIVNINNLVEEFSTVQMMGGLIETGSGQLGITQSVTSLATNVPATINGYLDLTPATSTLTVADGAADPDLQINAVVFGAATRLIKQGPGTLALAGANQYVGDTLVSQGILEVENISAFGSGNKLVTVTNATVSFNGSGSVTHPFLISGSGSPNAGGVLDFGNSTFTLSGSITLAGSSTVSVGPSGDASLTGVISGTGPLTKAGQGDLVLGGTSANTFSGDTVVSVGFLDLRKSSFVAAVPNNLVIGPATSTAIVTAFGTGEIAGGTITVNQNGILDLNGFVNNVARLNLNDGGRAQTEAGSLNFSGGGLVAVGSLSPSGSRIGASISGNIGLSANSDLTFGVNSYSIFAFPAPTAPELDVSAFIPKPVENASFAPAGIVKNGFGTMRLTANNTYHGYNTINGGTLEVDGSQAASQVYMTGGTLSGTGVVANIYPNASAAVVSPGHAGPGVLVCSNLNVNASGPGVLQVDLNGVTPGSAYDQLDCKGSVNLTGLSLSASLNFASNLGNHFLIINNEGPSAVTGTFSGLPEGASLYIGGERFSITYVGGDGNDVVLTRLATPPKPTLAIQRVPPSSMRLLWGTNFTGYTLQSATNVASVTWTNVSTPPVIIGTNYVVTNSAAPPLQIYRLKQ